MQLAIKQETVARLDEIARNFQLATKEEASPFSTALATATAINELRALLTPEVMKPFMALMNSPLGFLTDRTGRPNWKGETKPLYSVDVVRDALIEATLRGFYPVGNEFNIIAERFYAAKNGLRRKVLTYPGLTDFRDTYSVPRNVGENAVVEAKATWKLNGKPDELVRTFAVKGDKYAGADAFIGKATRKLLAAVLERISGQSVPEGEADEVDVDSLKIVEGREVNYDDPRERALAQWKKDCEATEAYNQRLREQGASEDELEPLPPRPDLDAIQDEIPGLAPAANVVPLNVPWRDYEVQHFSKLKGKKLGELSPAVLEKIRDTIAGMSPAVKATKPGIDELLKKVKEGIAELEPPKEEPRKATPLEGLQNLMQASGVSEEQVLQFVRKTWGKNPGMLINLGPEIVEELVADWPLALQQIKGE